MEGASGGLRSAAELVAAAQGLRGLLEAGLLSQDRYDDQITVLETVMKSLHARGSLAFPARVLLSRQCTDTPKITRAAVLE